MDVVPDFHGFVSQRLRFLDTKHGACAHTHTHPTCMHIQHCIMVSFPTGLPNSLLRSSALFLSQNYMLCLDLAHAFSSPFPPTLLDWILIILSSPSQMIPAHKTLLITLVSCYLFLLWSPKAPYMNNLAFPTLEKKRFLCELSAQLHYKLFYCFIYLCMPKKWETFLIRTK
jgi:hypothetical protein